MLSSQNPSLLNPNKSPTFADHNTNMPNIDNRARRRGRPWCEYCKKPSHIKHICWNLYGKPPNWKS